MDKTKDTFASENEAQNDETVNETAQNSPADSEDVTGTQTSPDTADTDNTAPEDDAANNKGEAATQFEFGTAGEADGEGAKAPEKKKSTLNASIITALIIVVVAALSLLAIKCFFDNSIVGTWVQTVEDESSTATSDEASSDEAQTISYYYVFNNDKTFELVVGTLSQLGTYSLDTDSSTGEPIVTLTLNSGSSSELYYSVSGNIFTGKTLTLSAESTSSTDSTSSTTTSYELKAASLPGTSEQLTIDSDFTPNSDLIGKWTYDDPYYGYSYSYTFYEDGTAVISQAISGESDMLRVNGTYTYTDDTIVITYYYNDETEMEITYEVTDDGLALNELEYTKDTGESTTTAAETEAEATTAAAE